MFDSCRAAFYYFLFFSRVAAVEYPDGSHGNGNVRVDNISGSLYFGILGKVHGLGTGTTS